MSRSCLIHREAGRTRMLEQLRFKRWLAIFVCLASDCALNSCTITGNSALSDDSDISGAFGHCPKIFPGSLALETACLLLTTDRREGSPIDIRYDQSTHARGRSSPRH